MRRNRFSDTMGGRRSAMGLTEILRPVAVVSGAWDVSTPITYINEVVVQDNVGDGNAFSATTDTTSGGVTLSLSVNQPRQKFAFIKRIDLWVYWKGIDLNTTAFNLNVGGLQQTAQTLAPSTTYIWSQFNFYPKSGEWPAALIYRDPAATNQLQVLITPSTLKEAGENLYVDTVYLELFGR